jgi:coatomer protein complex subunit gamma
VVRAAAVSALARYLILYYLHCGRFGALCPGLRANVITLLSRCVYDSDDEVRDRACFFKDLLQNQPPAVMSRLVLNGIFLISAADL